MSKMEIPPRWWWRGTGHTTLCSSYRYVPKLCVALSQTQPRNALSLYFVHLKVNSLLGENVNSFDSAFILDPSRIKWHGITRGEPTKSLYFSFFFSATCLSGLPCVCLCFCSSSFQRPCCKLNFAKYVISVMLEIGLDHILHYLFC
jgi:hypothetical protein